MLVRSYATSGVRLSSLSARSVFATDVARQMSSVAGASQSGSVPDWLVGVWERRYIRSASDAFAPSGDLDLLGPENRDTTVRYLQTPRLFIDIRIPAARPAGALPAGGLATATAEDLSALLADRKGSAFAGLAEVWERDNGEERVHWHAAYNFFPPNDSATLWPQIDAGRHTTGDIGRVDHQEHGSRWFEWGTKQRTFVEEWVKVDDGSSSCLALRRPGEMLLVVGDWFSYVRDSRDPSAPLEPPPRGGLAAFLESESVTTDEKRALVRSVAGRAPVDSTLLASRPLVRFPLGRFRTAGTAGRVCVCVCVCMSRDSGPLVC